MPSHVQGLGIQRKETKRGSDNQRVITREQVTREKQEDNKRKTDGLKKTTRRGAPPLSNSRVTSGQKEKHYSLLVDEL